MENGYRDQVRFPIFEILGTGHRNNKKVVRLENLSKMQYNIYISCKTKKFFWGNTL